MCNILYKYLNKFIEDMYIVVKVGRMRCGHRSGWGETVGVAELPHSSLNSMWNVSIPVRLGHDFENCECEVEAAALFCVT